MKKIELTPAEIQVIEDQLAGKIELHTATDEQQELLSGIIDRAEQLYLSNPAEDIDGDLIAWFYNRYKQQNKNN